MNSMDLSRFIDEDGHIVATCINSGYFDYLHNLHENIKRTDVKWTLCTVCMDAEAFQKCEDAGIPAIKLMYKNAHYEDAELRAYSSWNDANWNKTTFMKLNAIQWLLSFPEIKTMTYMDSDIHIYRDFVPQLKRLSTNVNEKNGNTNTNSNHEIWIQSDHNVCDTNSYGWALCSGFFHFRNTSRLQQIFQYGEEDVKKYKFNSDQEHIVEQIRRHGISAAQLSRAEFPNGVFAKMNRIPKEAYLIHYNYMVGVEKKKKMAQNGDWYLTHLNILRHKTATVYPPFKSGLYLEEYFSKHNTIRDNRYIDVHWTNIQIEPRFRQIQPLVQKLVDQLYPAPKPEAESPKTSQLSTLPNSNYFTIVQHDDGVMFNLPPNTRIYNAGGNINTNSEIGKNTVPIPLIYEDNQRRLESMPKLGFNEKTILCSFVGSMTHRVRSEMHRAFATTDEFQIHFTEKWTDMVNEKKQEKYIDITRKSKFCLAPRGYGRTSFRFYEAFLLGTVPIYIWDDVEWLPYKNEPVLGLDYSKFAISIHVSELYKLKSRLDAIGEMEYNRMLEEYRKVARMFTLEGMTEYIVQRENVC